MEIRRLENRHALRCAELEAVLFPGEDPWSEQAFYSEFSYPTNLYIGAFDHQDRLIGYAGLAMVGPRLDPEFEIHTIGVDPAHQGEGVGRAMMEQLMAVADRHNGPVFLEVRTDNTPALSLYESLGFVVTGTRKNYYQPSGADAFTMHRPQQGT